MTPYYDRDGITIYHGDCRDVLPTLPDRSVALVLTDPPFSVPVQYQDVSFPCPRSWGDLTIMEPFFSLVFREIRRIAGDGQVYIHCDSETYPVFFRVAYSIWPQSHVLVWYKPSGRRGRGWLHSHEFLLHLRTPATRYAAGFRQDVIGVMPVRTLKRQHPAEKPGDLLDFVAEALPDPDSLILDPFMGSGTTLATARRLGHRSIGIEIEERWCEAAARRFEQGLLPLQSA